jgi:glutathione S-transferase
VLRFWELSLSPNNVKVRLALRFKQIEFEAVPVDPRDRSRLLEVSGQELTPVIEDRGIVLNDSEAILHYLDANYPDTPRLSPRERAGRRSCDEWTAELDRRIATPWSAVFFYGIRLRKELDENARREYHEGLDWLEVELGEGDSFGGREMPIRDLRAAVWAVYALPGDGLLARVPQFGTLAELFAAEPKRLPRLSRFLEPWNARLA